MRPDPIDAWTWRDDHGVVHCTRGDKGRYQAMMRQIVCLESWMDLIFLKSGREQPVTCVLCAGSR